MFQMRTTVFCAFFALALASEQTITVKGTAICQRKRQKFIDVELLEKDRFTFNDHLNKTKTNEEGEFSLFGHQDEWNDIEPFIEIAHTCRILKQGCRTVTRFEVPGEYIGSTYDMTFVALDIAQAKETTVCP